MRQIEIIFLCVIVGCVQRTVADGGMGAGAAPVIGIVGVPFSEGCDTLMSGQGDATTSCMTDVYSKWVEMSGSRSVGIAYDMHDKAPNILQSLLNGLNGVLYTGGGLDIEANPPNPAVNAYLNTLTEIYRTAILKKRRDQVHFPIWGTCMGLQSLSIIGSGRNGSVVKTGVFDSEDISLPIFVRDDAKRSVLFRAMPGDVLQTLTRWNVTANLHHDGVLPEEFTTNTALRDSFMLTATSFDRKGKEFAAMMEHRSAPIYATQYHPERPAFEWTIGHNFNRTAPSLHAMRFLSEFFISEARRNKQQLRGEGLAYAEKYAVSGMDSRLLYGNRLNYSRVYDFRW